ncbi:MAG TPA: hypothetical protein VLA56_07025 [Pseudomonadales bacterium]|nr:hypothetical protein [Pseudomonadales bacterium]
MATSLAGLLEAQGHRLALLIGNGINRYRAAAATNSWNDLLAGLAQRHGVTDGRAVPPGIALTEFFDVLELATGQGDATGRLQAEFCEGMADWRPFAQHRRVVAWARAHGTPILTTNFDGVLAAAGDCTLQHLTTRGFTDFYPWESCFAPGPVTDPAAAFAIWHLNGTAHYRRSVRLGLTHYMGAVFRARSWIRPGARSGLHGRGTARWRGRLSWLQILFTRPLLILGLGLEENEVFLRWLLIERARYFRRFPRRRLPAWYLHTEALVGTGKDFFLRGVDVQPVAAAGFDELYAESTWSGTSSGPAPGST